MPRAISDCTRACPCDAITVNPYMGLETIEPFVAVAEKQGRGVVVLARTSNPGSTDFQARLIDGEPLYIRVGRVAGPDDRAAEGRERLVRPDAGCRRNGTGGCAASACCRERRTLPRARLWRAGRGPARCDGELRQRARWPRRRRHQRLALGLHAGSSEGSEKRRGVGQCRLRRHRSGAGRTGRQRLARGTSQPDIDREGWAHRKPMRDRLRAGGET